MKKLKHGVNVGFRHTDLAKKKSNIEKGTTLIDNDILTEENLSTTEKIVYIYISSKKTKEKISTKKLVEAIGVSRVTISTVLKKLEEVNLLERVRIPNENEYIYILKPIQEISVDK